MTTTIEPPVTQEPETRATTEAAEPQDIYALLGVTRDVSPALAREIYWIRVERFREEQQRDSLDADRQVEALNQALGVILDDGLRARYDRDHRPETARVSSAVSRLRRLRAGAVLSLMLLTVLASIYAAVQAGPLLLAGVVTTGMLAVIAVVAWPRKQQDQPFSLLHLAPGAGVREVNLAYEVNAQELLSRLRTDPSVIGRLERLDRAHEAALRLVAAAEAGPVEVRRGMVARVVRVLARGMVALARFLLGALGALTLAVLLWIMKVGGRAAVGAGRRLRVDAGRFSRMAQRQEEDPPEDLLEFSIDVSRRLAIGPQPEASSDAAGAEPDGDVPLAVASGPRHQVLLDALLVLETSAGVRRVPIPAAPLSIGSGPDCDLVLPPDLGVAHEHAHVWQRDGNVVIHVLSRRIGACLVNDQPMTWASLEDGDVILLGDARFSVLVR